MTSPTATPPHAKARATKPRRQPPMAAASQGHDDRRRRARSSAPLRSRASSRAWVRNPVCATMRWSGRIDWPSTCQRALQHFERLDHAERRVRELLAQPADLQDRREVRDEDAAGPQRLDRVLHDAPRLGEVEHDAIEVALVDALRRRRGPARRAARRRRGTRARCAPPGRAKSAADLVAGDAPCPARSRAAAPK